MISVFDQINAADAVYEDISSMIDNEVRQIVWRAVGRPVDNTLPDGGVAVISEVKDNFLRWLK